MTESGTRLYSDLEVDNLIDELSDAAYEAIEQAAAEAARSGALAALEREAAALREAQHWRVEAETARRNGRKNAIISGLVFFLGGLAVGVGGTLIIGGR